MKKLKLNKKAIIHLDNSSMSNIVGGKDASINCDFEHNTDQGGGGGNTQDAYYCNATKGCYSKQCYTSEEVCTGGDTGLQSAAYAGCQGKQTAFNAGC